MVVPARGCWVEFAVAVSEFTACSSVGFPASVYQFLLHCNTQLTARLSAELKNGKAMRHAISVLLENEVGALTRVTGMFSSRGYNIDSLNVAATDDPMISRVTLVVSGTDEAIAKLNTQLAKLVDVVNIHDMTIGDHFERELAIIKLKLDDGNLPAAKALAKKYNSEMLDDSLVSCTLQLTGRVAKIDNFISDAAKVGELSAVARSGSVAVSKGEVTLSSFDRHYRLSG
jgi:acetolactate synthase-1/3 small subunit